MHGTNYYKLTVLDNISRLGEQTMHFSLIGMQTVVLADDLPKPMPFVYAGPANMLGGCIIKVHQSCLRLCPASLPLTSNNKNVLFTVSL